MSASCYCDYDQPDFCSVTHPKARKPHHCCECGGPISPGERYEYCVGKWCGWFSYYKLCERCHDIRQWVQNNVPCLCWAYGNLDDDLREAVNEARYRAPDETIGLHFGLLRRFVLRDRWNKRAAT